MIFLSTFIVILWLYLFQSSFSAERVLLAWHNGLSRRFKGVLLFVVAVVVPVLLLMLLLSWLYHSVSVVVLMLIYVPVLWLCLGAGDMDRLLERYINAADRQDNIAAREWVDTMSPLCGDDVAQQHKNDALAGWSQLHQQALDATGYMALQRYFAVLFWFFVTGPAGALAYRLADIHHRGVQHGNANAPAFTTLVYGLEWPASRLLGLSWALVGQFDTVMAVIKRDGMRRVSINRFVGNCLAQASGPGAWLATTDARAVVTPTLADQAMSQDERLQTMALRNAIGQAGDLLSRTLLLWMCASALITLAL